MSSPDLRRAIQPVRVGPAARVPWPGDPVPARARRADAAPVVVGVWRAGAGGDGAAGRVAVRRTDEGLDDGGPDRAVDPLAVVVPAAVAEVDRVVHAALLHELEHFRLGAPFRPAGISPGITEPVGRLRLRPAGTWKWPGDSCASPGRSASGC